MMYSNKLVAVVSVAGKTAREVNDENGSTVYLPFGSEYSLKLKNLNSKRAVVSVSIDDKDVLNGSRLVIDPNDETDLQGFLNGNVAHNRFKFIEKTQEISDHRGDRAGDGLIRIEFQFEQDLNGFYSNYRRSKSSRGINPNPWTNPWNNPEDNKPTWQFNSSGGETLKGCSTDGPQCVNQIGSAEHGMMSFAAEPRHLNEDGITVAGSVVDQRFSTTHVNCLEVEKHVIVLQLKGKTTQNVKVTQPLLTRTTSKCGTCGRQNKTHNKFCANCGTCLV